MAAHIHSSSPADSNIRHLSDSRLSKDRISLSDDESTPGAAHAGSRASNDAASNDGNDEAQDEAQDEGDFRVDNIDDENPHLMAYLENSNSDNSNAIASTSEEEGDDDADLDDSMIEAEEEQAIRAELRKRGRGSSLPGPVSLRRLSQSQQARNQHGADSDDSEASDANTEASSWGDELLEDYFDLPGQGGIQPNGFDARYTEKNDNDSNLSIDGLESNDNDSGADDSYLWQYFFSSDENAPNTDQDQSFAFSNPTARARERRLSRSRRSQSQNNTAAENSGSTDDDLPLKGRGPLPPSQMSRPQPAGYVPSGDSTDEDDGVPPERKKRRARGTKAIEVLGSNSFSARPPVLGSWKIKGDKNVGIIDGLTTRTLSPPPSQDPPQSAQASAQSPTYQDNDSVRRREDPKDPFEGLDDDASLLALGDFTDFDGSEYKDSPVRQGPHDPLRNPVQIDDSQFDGEVSDLDLLELGDFLNTEALSSGDENEGAFEFDLIFDPTQPEAQQSQPQKQFRSPTVSPYLYRNRLSNRNVPISAFRNRGSPYVSNPAYPSDNQSPAPRRARRTSLNSRRPTNHGRDAFLSPGNARKRSKRTKSRTGSTTTQAEGAAGDHDFIGELIEIGAISPLFEIDN